MSELKTAALVALLRIGAQPHHIYSELVEQGDTPLALLERELTETPAGQQTLGAPEPDRVLDAARAQLASWGAAGIRAITVLDAAYPENLRAVFDRPPLIFIRGTLQATDRRAIAVIGSRHASPDGLERARSLAAHLATSDFTVISGLARGVDTEAHTTTQAAGGRTIAVIGTGHDHSYPPENANLQREIADAGAVISQFTPGTHPTARNFPIRNALMSGLGLATVIVEASYTSGTRTQARRALAHGRPVFLEARLTTQDWARELGGCANVHVYDEPGQITELVERLDQTGPLAA